MSLSRRSTARSGERRSLLPAGGTLERLIRFAEGGSRWWRLHPGRLVKGANLSSSVSMPSSRVGAGSLWSKGEVYANFLALDRTYARARRRAARRRGSHNLYESPWRTGSPSPAAYQRLDVEICMHVASAGTA